MKKPEELTIQEWCQTHGTTVTGRPPTQMVVTTPNPGWEKNMKSLFRNTEPGWELLTLGPDEGQGQHLGRATDFYIGLKGEERRIEKNRQFAALYGQVGRTPDLSMDFTDTELRMSSRVMTREVGARRAQKLRRRGETVRFSKYTSTGKIRFYWVMSIYYV